MEYAKQGIRVNAVAPGVVATPLLQGLSKDFLQSLSPMGQIGTTQDIADAVLFLTEAPRVTGVVLNVDAAHTLGKW
jgi:NAD(P)-dependent dehydrogenase (short-subunit alcohol dehydrogenase family)